VTRHWMDGAPLPITDKLRERVEQSLETMNQLTCCLLAADYTDLAGQVSRLAAEITFTVIMKDRAPECQTNTNTPPAVKDP